MCYGDAPSTGVPALWRSLLYGVHRSPCAMGVHRGPCCSHTGPCAHLDALDAGLDAELLHQLAGLGDVVSGRHRLPSAPGPAMRILQHSGHRVGTAWGGGWHCMGMGLALHGDGVGTAWGWCHIPPHPTHTGAAVGHGSSPTPPDTTSSSPFLRAALVSRNTQRNLLTRGERCTAFCRTPRRRCPTRAARWGCVAMGDV